MDTISTSKKFDTASKRYNAALVAFGRFGWIVTKCDGEKITAIKDDRNNLYKHIEGSLMIFYNATTSEIITTLNHEKKGHTSMLRTVQYKKQLRNIIGNPRTHTGLKAKYLKP